MNPKETLRYAQGVQLFHPVENRDPVPYGMPKKDITRFFGTAYRRMIMARWWLTGRAGSKPAPTENLAVSRISWIIPGHVV